VRSPWNSGGIRRRDLLINSYTYSRRGSFPSPIYLFTYEKRLALLISITTLFHTIHITPKRNATREACDYFSKPIQFKNVIFDHCRMPSKDWRSIEMVNLRFKNSEISGITSLGDIT
jgi:hypothetical protein